MSIKLSIITPFYNTLKETKELADCLLPQLTEETEWIIVDDGTNEHELDRINNNTLHLDKNSGNASRPRNIGLDRAQGKYIAFVDSDDLVTPDYIEKVINKIDSEDFDYCYISWQMDDYKYIIEDEPLEWNKSVWNCIYKRDVIGQERFDEKLNICEDEDFNNRVRKGKKANIKDVLYIYNWQKREDSLTSLYEKGIIPDRRD